MTSKSLTLHDLRKKIDDVKIGMFTTLDGSGQMTSRPMTSQEVDADGVLWFFTSLQSDISRELTIRPQVNVSFAEPKDSFYVSLGGRAALVTDRGAYARLWNPLIRAWFPRGLDDPDLALIRFDIDSAEYWDSDSSRMVQMLKLVQAVVTGNGTTANEFGRHGTIEM